MAIEILTLSEQEQEVIERAIDYVAQMRNGIYRDVDVARFNLFEAVDDLVQEHDGRWQPREAQG
jgi:hypothetical protein